MFIAAAAADVVVVVVVVVAETSDVRLLVLRRITAGFAEAKYDSDANSSGRATWSREKGEEATVINGGRRTGAGSSGRERKGWENEQIGTGDSTVIAGYACTCSADLIYFFTGCQFL